MKTKRINKIIKIINKYGIYVNHGLAPNPFGFTWENDWDDDDKDRPTKDLEELDKLLDQLTNEEEKQLKQYLYK